MPTAICLHVLFVIPLRSRTLCDVIDDLDCPWRLRISPRTPHVTLRHSSL